MVPIIFGCMCLVEEEFHSLIKIVFISKTQENKLDWNLKREKWKDSIL